MPFWASRTRRDKNRYPDDFSMKTGILSTFSAIAVAEDQLAGRNTLGQNMAELEEEKDIQRDRQAEKCQGDIGEDVHPGTNRLQILQQFLLFQSVAVGGFTHLVQLVLDLFERLILLHYLVAQLALLQLELV